MCDFYKRLETQARIKSESLETVARQSSCVETNMPASSFLAQRNAGTLVAVSGS